MNTGMIRKTAVVADTDYADFLDKLDTTISKMQSEDITLEIQFTTALSDRHVIYSALILARDAD